MPKNGVLSGIKHQRERYFLDTYVDLSDCNSYRWTENRPKDFLSHFLHSFQPRDFPCFSVSCHAPTKRHHEQDLYFISTLFNFPSCVWLVRKAV
jgi:hypothetical protein